MPILEQIESQNTLYSCINTIVPLMVEYCKTGFDIKSNSTSLFEKDHKALKAIVDQFDFNCNVLISARNGCLLLEIESYYQELNYVGHFTKNIRLENGENLPMEPFTLVTFEEYKDVKSQIDYINSQISSLESKKSSLEDKIGDLIYCN